MRGLPPGIDSSVRKELNRYPYPGFRDAVAVDAAADDEARRVYGAQFTPLLAVYAGLQTSRWDSFYCATYRDKV